MTLGLTEGILAGIERGEVDWDLIPNEATDESDLLLSHEEGGTRYQGTLTREQVDELMNAWDFERRPTDATKHPAAFPPGTYDDWTGVRQETNWEHLVQTYRKAAVQLAEARSQELAEPWLFLCRHALELQLKAVIMLGQEALGLDADLPDHHDLQRLWTAAYPFMCLRKGHNERTADVVRTLVGDYHAADPGGASFRYPVSRNNRPLQHPDFLHRFSREQHASHFATACDYLSKALSRLRFRSMLRRAFGTSRSP
jgi:hypothetical protein